MRTALRKRGVKHLKVVYSQEQAPRPIEDMSISCRSHCICPPGAKHKCTERRDIPGSTAFVPSVAGLIIAGEVVRGSGEGMKKTFILPRFPITSARFLAASRRFAALGINITRVSYNKAVDSHTIFIEAEGSGEQLAQADRQLEAIGYLHGSEAEKSVVLLEFQLRDEPGGLTDILALIEQFGFNISYLSSQENGTDCQFFKMGLFVDDPARIRTFLAQAEQLCPACA